MTLVACMCNHPERLAEALQPLPLALPAPVGRWGLASVVGGEVLMARTPRPAEGGLDLAAEIAAQRSDCVIAQVRVDDVRAEAAGEDLPPFRFRRWMLGEDPTARLHGRALDALVARIPEFLRRNLRGRTSGELMLHVLIARLHEQGLTDDAGLGVAALARLTVETIAQVASLLSDVGGAPFPGGNVAVSNSRAMAVVAVAAPLAVYPLRVWNDRGVRDESFRGVVVASGLPAPQHRGDPADAVPEVVPVGSMVTVSRDLQVAIVPRPEG